MRMSTPSENLIGKVCVCSVGRPFIVTDNDVNLPGLPGKYYVGLGLDGKGTVASSAPCVLAESGREFHDKLLERFGGKMSYNG